MKIPRLFFALVAAAAPPAGVAEIRLLLVAGDQDPNYGPTSNGAFIPQS